MVSKNIKKIHTFLNNRLSGNKLLFYWFKVIEMNIFGRIKYFFPHPRNIHVALLNRCNLNCVMCPYHSPVYKPHHNSGYFKNTKIMSEETFLKIIDYAGKCSISLQFGQIEEPLLHPKIFDFIKKAKDAGVSFIHMTTNGTLLTNENAIKLSQTGINSVMFSLDAASPETYKKIRGQDLSKTEENIKNFISLAKKNCIKITVSFILQSQAISEREEFVDKWREKGVDAVTFYVLTNHDLNTGELIRSEEIYLRGKRYPCAAPWTQSVVFPEGEISLCCKTLIDVGWKGIVSVGNLNHQTFEEIWHGKGYKKVRKELLKNSFEEFETCKNCPIWSTSTYLFEYKKDWIKTYNESSETFTFRKS